MKGRDNELNFWKIVDSDKHETYLCAGGVRPVVLSVSYIYVDMRQSVRR
jgi:hypothetical protein